MEAVGSSKTQVTIHEPSRCHIPKQFNLHQHHGENIKPGIISAWFVLKKNRSI